MAITVLLHINNEEPILGEIDRLPSPSDTILIVNNPRMKDGKDIRNLAANVTTVFWPMTRMTFVEVMPTDQEEEVVGFVRER